MKLRSSKIGFFVAIMASTSSAAIAQQAGQLSADTANEEASNPNDIIVTARRSEERLQDVPIAVSVIMPDTIDAKGTFNPIDLVQSTPGLAVSASIADRANLTYTIRGQGFFVTNLTDKLYRIGTNDLMQKSSVGTVGSIYAAPRMWGFNMKYRFGGDAS